MIISFKIEALADGNISVKRAKEKWREAMASVARESDKGKPLFIHDYDEKSAKQVLYYHQSYGNDWCDTMFEGTFSEYEDGCQIFGEVKASKIMKRLAVIIAAASIPIAFLINAGIYTLIDFILANRMFDAELLRIYNPAATFAALAIVGLIAAVMSVAVDKRRVKDIIEYLHKFLIDEKSDKNDINNDIKKAEED